MLSTEFITAKIVGKMSSMFAHHLGSIKHSASMK